MENYVKTYLLEKNDLKSAVKRAFRTMRFSWNSRTQKTPLEIYFESKPRSIITNIVNLDNAGKDLIETIVEKTGNQLTQIHYTTKSPKEMAKDRNFGKSAETEDLRKELRRRKVSNCRYFVVKNRNKRASSSKFESKIRKLVNETEHTISDGRKTFHKKDVAEVSHSVVKNQVELQAREIAERVEKNMKNLKRGKGGRFSNVTQPGKTEEVKAKEGRRVTLESSDSEEEALAKVKRQQKNAAKSPKTSANRTGTTPPVSPSKSQNSEIEQEPDPPPW